MSWTDMFKIVSTLSGILLKKWLYTLLTIKHQFATHIWTVVWWFCHEWWWSAMTFCVCVVDVESGMSWCFPTTANAFCTSVTYNKEADFSCVLVYVSEISIWFHWFFICECLPLDHALLLHPNNIITEFIFSTNHFEQLLVTDRTNCCDIMIKLRDRRKTFVLVS